MDDDAEDRAILADQGPGESVTVGTVSPDEEPKSAAALAGGEDPSEAVESHDPDAEQPTTGTAATTRSSATASAKRVKNLIEWLVIIAVALIVALGVRQFVFQPFWIPSGSMENTLDIGDRVLVNKASYRFHGIRHGDVVVFKQPKSWPLAASVKDLIKRVIAIPGDEVYIHDCSVWLNGKKLVEPYTSGRCTEPAEAVLDPDGDGKFVVPAKMIFVMGDNRTGSTDSRFNGFVPKSDVLGRAFVVLWPRSHWRWL